MEGAIFFENYDFSKILSFFSIRTKMVQYVNSSISRDIKNINLITRILSWYTSLQFGYLEIN